MPEHFEHRRVQPDAPTGPPPYFIVYQRKTTSAVPGDDLPVGWYWTGGDGIPRGPYDSHAHAELAALSFDPNNPDTFDY